MKKNKSVFNNILVLVISQCIVKILGLVYKLYLANKAGFGDAGNAIYNSGYQVYALLLTLASIGVPNAVAKLVAEKKFCGNREEVAKILKSSLIVFSIIGLTGSIFLAIFAEFIANNLLNISGAKYTLISLAPAVFNVCIISVYRGFYNGINEMKITANSQTIEQVFKTILTIIFVEIAYTVTSANTIIMATVANLATTVATFISLIYIYNKNELKNVNVKFEYRTIKKILKVSVPISLSAILASLNRNIDSITVVRYLKNTIGEHAAILQYGVLTGKIDILVSFPISFIVTITTTIIPIIAALNSQNNKSEICKIGKKYFLFTILFAVPCSLGMIIFSDKILQLLFNSSNGSILLKISGCSIIFISLEQIVNSILQGIGKIYIPAMSISVGVITKIILNIYLIKLPYTIGGIAGACISTLICHIIAFGISFSIMKKNIKIKLEFTKYVLKPLITSCIMALCLYSTYFLMKGIIAEKMAIIVSIIVAIFMYIISIFLFKILNKDEIKLIPVLSNFIKK